MSNIGKILVVGGTLGFAFFVDLIVGGVLETNPMPSIAPTPTISHVFQPTTEALKEYRSKLVLVKYGSFVDIGHSRFEYLDTSGSSFVGGAWYDVNSQYMVINLNGTYYHYCRMPSLAWNNFKKANSFGSHYNMAVKGLYDCRLGGIPDYAAGASSQRLNFNPPSALLYNSPAKYYYSGRTLSDVYVYGDCEEGNYCYGEDEDGNEVEFYANEVDDGYGYGETDNGAEVEFYCDDCGQNNY